MEGRTNLKLLEQPIPASYLQLEERVRVIATDLKHNHEPPLLKENQFREKTCDIITDPRQLDQAVTFLHDNGERGESGGWGVVDWNGERGELGERESDCRL